MRFVLLLFVVVASVPAFAEDVPKEFGMDMVPWSKKVGEKRYESPRDYEGTVKFFRDKWKNNSKAVKWSREVSLPSVKYIHVDSLTDSTKWSGINIYAMPDGRVRYFVLERDAPAPAATPKSASAPAKPGAPATTSTSTP